jgi:hypothetical protein
VDPQAWWHARAMYGPAAQECLWEEWLEGGVLAAPGGDFREGVGWDRRQRRRHAMCGVVPCTVQVAQPDMGKCLCLHIHL